ncbi:phosphoglycolate phosphatase [Massilia jejuensis]|uniref:Phosphoglycolate phosphatase n=1 Tax=Massilia jejuensis TaxID=648894 RepID=A0ABW0PEC4_9BURK
MNSIDFTHHTRHAVLIDLDGTLVDSAPDIVEAVRRLLLDLHAAPLSFDTVRGFIGHGVPTLIRRVLRASALTHIDEVLALALFQRHYRDTNGRYGDVYPGVRAGLAALQGAGYRLGCVTNKFYEASVALLDIHALAPWFEVVVGGDTLSQMKPAAEPLLHACRALHARLDRCVLVGDSHVDIAAARAAQMPVFIVRYGYPGPEGHAAMACDGFIDSLEELPAMLDAANQGRQ